MPKSVERLVKKLQVKGIDKSSAYAIATSKLKKTGKKVDKKIKSRK